MFHCFTCFSAVFTHCWSSSGFIWFPGSGVSWTGSSGLVLILHLFFRMPLMGRGAAITVKPTHNSSFTLFRPSQAIKSLRMGLNTAGERSAGLFSSRLVKLSGVCHSSFARLARREEAPQCSVFSRELPCCHGNADVSRELRHLCCDGSLCSNLHFLQPSHLHYTYILCVC